MMDELFTKNLSTEKFVDKFFVFLFQVFHKRYLKLTLISPVFFAGFDCFAVCFVFKQIVL